MKKIVLPISLLLPHLCFASTVTMYGVLDTSLEVSKAPGEDTLVQMSPGFQSGNRYGFRGEEEIGGGYKVFFQLEQGLKLDTGAEHKSGLAFSRQANLGVAGSFGEVSFGRLGALSSDCGSYSILPVSFIGTSYSAKANSYSALILTDRYNNMVVYKTPSFGGFTISAMYSNGTPADENKWSTNNHYYGLGGVYHNKNLTLTGIIEYLDNKAQASANIKPKGTQLYTIGVGYDFGSVNLAGTYQFSNNALMVENYMDVGKFIGENSLRKGARQNAFVLSADVPLAGGRAGMQVNYANGKFLDSSAGNKDYSTISVGAAYTYPFSNRTNLYSYAGYGATKKALKTDDANSIRGYSLAIGLRHKF